MLMTLVTMIFLEGWVPLDYLKIYGFFSSNLLIKRRLTFFIEITCGKFRPLKKLKIKYYKIQRLD
jgi:hypothetical protein